MRAFLERAAINHRSMLISGGTSTGKTTFLNTMLTAIPNNERFVLMCPKLDDESESDAKPSRIN